MTALGHGGRIPQPLAAGGAGRHVVCRCAAVLDPEDALRQRPPRLSEQTRSADPVDLLTSYPGRTHLMHVKDMKEKKQFSGDGGNSNQWIELFPYMTTAGDGVMNLRAIIEQVKKSGVKHFFVEQDVVANPDVALKRSFDYVKAL